MYFEVAFIAYIIDRLFGEFSFIRHPVVVMGDYIKWFEKWFYKATILRGILLTASLIFITFIFSFAIQYLLSWRGHPYLHTLPNILLLGFIASTTIASKMLYESVKEIINTPENIKYLVSRDTNALTNSDINKATIETYAENLSDGVIAPLFYLVLFGLPGAFVYKAINTLDSMVGYHNARYEKFGKFSAKLDDVANYIPSRITAVLIALLMGSKKALVHFYHYGKKHESPNAGHPISAMALVLGIKLGGDTSYFGKVKKKAHFGEGKEDIVVHDIDKALSFQWRLDILLVLFLGVGLWV